MFRVPTNHADWVRIAEATHASKPVGCIVLYAVRFDTTGAYVEPTADVLQSAASLEGCFAPDEVEGAVLSSPAGWVMVTRGGLSARAGGGCLDVVALRRWLGLTAYPHVLLGSIRRQALGAAVPLVESGADAELAVVSSACAVVQMLAECSDVPATICAGVDIRPWLQRVREQPVDVVFDVDALCSLGDEWPAAQWWGASFFLQQWGCSAPSVVASCDHLRSGVRPETVRECFVTLQGLVPAVMSG